MKFKNEIYNITLSGILLGLALVMGFFAYFPLFGGNVYLVGAVVFVMPLVLPFGYAFITGVLAVVLTDIYSGFAMYCWISIIAYGIAICIIWLFTKAKIKAIYVFGLVIASIVVILTYLVLEWVVIDKAAAINDSLATTIEFAIVVPLASILYLPLKLIIKQTKK